MAFVIPGFTFSRPAASDLSAGQHHFVEIDSAGRVALTNGSGDVSDGVLQNDPNAIDIAANIMRDGVSKVVAGAAVAQGALVQSNAAGRAITAVSNGFVMGRALDAVGADGEVLSVALGNNHILP